MIRELEQWRRLGVATLPGPVREKGPRIPGWRDLPITECWARSRASAAQGPTNLLIRSGATTDPDRYLTSIDLDGKCPCGHAHADHAGDGCHDDGCDCRAYAGRDPDDALAELRERLPANVPISQTARGYHLCFLTTREVPAGLLDDYSAEIYGDGQALHVPGSIHPTGWHYRWIVEPDDGLPSVDLAAVGLHPTPKRSAPTSPRLGCERGSASRSRQRIFVDLMAQAGIHSQGRVEEHHPCPWHPDAATDSLHVDWERAIFHCFGCAIGGGLRQLRCQIQGGPPTYDPERPEIDQGSQLGGGLPTRRTAAHRYAEALRELGAGDRALKVDACASTFDWDPTRVTEMEAFVCPNGDSAPLRAVRPHSCDDGLCPVCMPFRLGQDWQKRVHAGVVPETGLALVQLQAASRSDGLDDTTYLPRVRRQLREYRRTYGLDRGFYGLTLAKEGLDWRAIVSLVIPDADIALIADSRTFTAISTISNATANHALLTWQELYLTEATGWSDAEELAALRRLTFGRRKFQGFGKCFGTSADAKESTDAIPPPLHQVAGGSGQAAHTAPCCPRCGAQLNGVGRYDPTRMEVIAAPDGLVEWRWRQAHERRAV